ncbi:hypothetical protein L2E82_05733 [Cichorium intybus]|uniref:Uncharacterized protein n=1 Tax=Cichorium intybus TaxID=13427 RepID=A0ACB9H849_CICIN|nr:hypothetical protein L2E82_05733 [Cichorium intybus]
MVSTGIKECPVKPGVKIAGNKQGAVDAGQKPKFTKSTASRMQQDQSKGMQVGGQKEVTKKQDSIQDDKGLEKRVNTGKTVTASSGVLKGKMKVVDKSNNENSSKPSKKEKIDNKEDIDVDKKAYQPGLRTLSTRMTPGKVSLTMKTLSDVQKEAVKSMGFESMLGMDIDNLPGKLNYILLENYDPRRNRLKVNKEWIRITKELVHDIMGLPMGGENIKELESCAYNDPVLQQWKAQFPKKLYSVKDYYKLIKDTKEDDIMFRLNFLVLFINTFMESKLMGTCEVKVVEKLIPVADVSCIDWCQYMVDCLESRKYWWKRDDRTCYYTGPMTLLLLTYVYSVKVPINNLKKGRPFIKYVTASQLDDIQKEEIKENRLGMGEIEKRCSENFENSNTETDVQAFEKEYGNVEVNKKTF